MSTHRSLFSIIPDDLIYELSLYLNTSQLSNILSEILKNGDRDIDKLRRLRHTIMLRHSGIIHEKIPKLYEWYDLYEDT